MNILETLSTIHGSFEALSKDFPFVVTERAIHIRPSCTCFLNAAAQPNDFEGTLTLLKLVRSLKESFRVQEVVIHLPHSFQIAKVETIDFNTRLEIEKGYGRCWNGPVRDSSCQASNFVTFEGIGPTWVVDMF